MELRRHILLYLEVQQRLTSTRPDICNSQYAGIKVYIPSKNCSLGIRAIEGAEKTEMKL
jgi:hypothetical protein